MARATARSKPSEMSIAVRVIRADGRVEELGTIAYWNKNPLRRLWWRLHQRRK